MVQGPQLSRKCDQANDARYNLMLRRSDDSVLNCICRWISQRTPAMAGR